jgi:hypothetical protein
VANTNNYSRAVEYRIDEGRMEIQQVWEYGRNSPERLFTDRVGNIEWLPQTGNVLINFGYTILVDGGRPNPMAFNSTMVRIKEVTHEADPEVVFDLALFDYANTSFGYRGYFTYRSHRIPDLYPVATAQARLEQVLLTVTRHISNPDDAPLLASLAAALDSLEQGRPQTAANQLRAFQQKLDMRTKRLDSRIIRDLYFRAQGLIDQLESGA